ncbi:MAG: hypothetical protein F6K41_34955 [Symploca sp. SIO3E6]|nr:hypothetical protein [Caldora sp. SIO3E6]
MQLLFETQLLHIPGRDYFIVTKLYIGRFTFVRLLIWLLQDLKSSDFSVQIVINKDEPIEEVSDIPHPNWHNRYFRNF